MVSGVADELAFHQVLEAVVDADDLDAVIDGLDGRRVDDAVDAGRRATADENAHARLGVELHDETSPEKVRARRGCDDGIVAPRHVLRNR